MTTEISTREQIIESADQLFYHQGFEPTSFADIAKAVQISRGNFYHHFKSKDEILGAVIELRLERTKDLLKQWDTTEKTPKDRIKKFIQMLIMNQTQLKEYGCPVGTLCTELAKLNHISKKNANKLMNLYKTWLSEQFSIAGLKKQADEFALHLLARSQGIATLANTFQDDLFIKKEVRLMEEWLHSKLS